MSPLHTASRSIRCALVLFAAVLVGVLPAIPAQAEPTLAEIEAEISKSWNKLEPLIEEYNKVHSDLKKQQKKAAELEKKISPLRVTVELTRTRVGVIASQYYMGGRTSELNAMMSSGSPARFADQLMLLEHITRMKQKQISATTKAKAKFDGQKEALDKIIAEQAKKDADLVARKKVIEAEVNRLQTLRLKAYGSNAPGGSLKIGGLCPATATGGKGQIAASWACKQIGKRYVFGDNGPNTFDCSGLTQWAWAKAGVELTHYTKAQWTEGTHVSTPQTGDLVFFYPNDGLHHMGMYVGTYNGRRVMVHAPHTGDVVRMQYIDVMPLAGYVRPS